MRNNDQTSCITEQKFFEHMQCHQVQVIRWLIENEEVGAFDQYAEEMETSFLATTQCMRSGMLLRGREQKTLEQFGCRDSCFANRDVFGLIFDNIQDRFVAVEENIFLLIMTDDERISFFDLATIGTLRSQEQFDKGRFAYAILTDDTDTFSRFEIVRECIENYFVAKFFAEGVNLKNFIT